MASKNKSSGYEPSYRESDVDDTLDEHNVRISRLEKAALIGAGYGLAQGNDIVQAILGFI